MKVNSNWIKREQLREKGQFWTPDWVAEAMVAYVLKGKSPAIFDPSVGEGAFIQAIKRVALEFNHNVEILGREIDNTVLEKAREKKIINSADKIELKDFLFDETISSLSAIVANPPYIRHHRLDENLKKKIKHLAKEIIGKPLDGRTGYHVYFLIRALSLLEKGGRLAFIVPSDTVEGIFAKDLWYWIVHHFYLDGIVTFTPEATPFPTVDINPIILLIRNDISSSCFRWGRCKKAETPQLKQWLGSDLKESLKLDIEIFEREIEEALRSGLSHPPSKINEDCHTLADFAFTQRGIATGNNDFFLFTPEEAQQVELSLDYFRPFIGRTRDVSDDEITLETIQHLQAKKRPTLLLYLGKESTETFPISLQQYLKKGEELGLPLKPLISQRKPWYKMEKRNPPPILFAYLGRRNIRFIRNRVDVVPLTGFLCIYPYNKEPAFADKLWQALNHPDTSANLSRVAKSYGGGAMKVEPRALEKLVIPTHVLQLFNIKMMIE